MKNKIFLSIIIFIFLIAIILSPQKYIQVSMSAIEVWCKILLPALFPFFVFTKILTSLGQVEKISSTFGKISYKIYKTNPISSYVFFMSILTGYPVGSKLIFDLYNCGKISKKDAKKCITFCSNSGPMFIVGSVGIGMLNSSILGYIILLSHISGSLINGLLYRNIKEEDTFNNPYKIEEENKSFSDIIFDSIFSIFLIGGIIIIAFIIIEIISSINLFFGAEKLLEKLGVERQIYSCFFNGIFEITKGCISVSNLTVSNCFKTTFICFILTFGGFSTMLQSMAFLSKICTYKFFILQKITHAVLSTFICLILCLLFSV